MSNRKNAHRRRLRVAVLAVVCGAVFAAFFARLAWMQFARADYYADKAADVYKRQVIDGAAVDARNNVHAAQTRIQLNEQDLPPQPRQTGPQQHRNRAFAGAAFAGADHDLSLIHIYTKSY